MKTNTINNTIKNLMLAICVIFAALFVSNSSIANASDIEPEYDLGPAIWVDGNGITHTSDGLAWGPDGIVYVESTEEPEYDLGPAIWVDGNGITHTSDGLAWGPDGVVYVEDIATGTGTSIGTAVRCYNLANGCRIEISVDENGAIASSIVNLEQLFDCDTVTVTYLLEDTNSLLFQVLAAETFETLLVIEVALPM